MPGGFVTEDFIAEIERQPAIWDTSHADYNNKTAKKVAWEEVVAKVARNYDNMDDTEKQNTIQHFQRKWKSLRDSFNREVHKKKKQKSTEVRKQYVYFDNLSFLQSIVKASTTNGTDVPVDDEISQEHDETFFKLTLPPLPPTQTEEPSESSKKRLNKKREAEEDELFAMLRDKVMNQKPDDDDKLFMLSLVPELKRIPESEKLNIKIELMNVFKRAKLRHDDPLAEDSGDDEGCGSNVEKILSDDGRPWDS